MLVQYTLTTVTLLCTCQRVTFTHVWTFNMWQCVKLYHSVLLPVHGNANEAEVHTVCTTENKAVKTKVAILPNKMLLAPYTTPQHSVAWFYRFYPTSWRTTKKCWFLKMFFMKTQHYLSWITLPTSISLKNTHERKQQHLLVHTLNLLQ